MQTKIHAYLAGYEKAFLSFAQSAQSDASAKYTAEPDRTEDGILVGIITLGWQKLMHMLGHRILLATPFIQDQSLNFSFKVIIG